MTTLWKAINFLVPEPQARVFGTVITPENYARVIWNDVRLQPDFAAVLAVSEQQKDDAVRDQKITSEVQNSGTVDPFGRGLIRVLARIDASTPAAILAEILSEARK